MIKERISLRAKVPTRTIIAAAVMLVGILLLASGYFWSRQTMIYAGLIITLGAVLTEVIHGIIGRQTERHRRTVSAARTRTY